MVLQGRMSPGSCRCSRAFQPPRPQRRVPPLPHGSRWHRSGWNLPSRTSTGPSTTACRPGSTTAAQPGVRVKVKFNGQELAGYLIDRVAESDAGHPLVPLHKVVSPVPVLTACRRRTRRAGRCALCRQRQRRAPRRRAPADGELEKDLAPDGVLDPSVSQPRGANPGPEPRFLPAWKRPAGPPTATAPAFLQHLNAGESPRAVLERTPGLRSGRMAPLIAEAVAAVRQSGRGAVVVVPDYRDLDRVESALAEFFLPATSPGSPRTTARPPATAASCGSSTALPGWLSAPAPQPTRRSRTSALWSAGTTATISTSSSAHPYAHSREVLLLRAEQEGAACLLAGHTRSTELQRLVDAGWALPVEAERAVVRRTVPRVLNTADSYEIERDPLARIARLPGAAWRAAKEGLERGPVLVQVARSGLCALAGLRNLP